MSIEAMSWALEQPIGGTSKIVLIGIASHADKYGRNAWPSVPTLSTYANVDARTVQRALADLINRGYLEREFQAGGTRYTVDELRPNLYHLNLGKKDVPGDTGVTPPGDTGVTPPGDTGVTPYIRPCEPSSSSLREEDTAGKLRTSRRRKELKTLAQFLEACRAEGVKPVPLTAPIRTYCHDAGIDDEMLQIAWLVFKDRHLNAQKDKRYKDWGKAFATSVKDRWYKLWFDDGEGVKWTATGLQEKRVIEARTAERRAGSEGAA